MLPFVRHEFEYPLSTSPITRLSETLGHHEWENLSLTHTGTKIVIVPKLGSFFRNSWNPIFQGKIVQNGDRSTLVGYFRVNWFVFAFSLLFVGHAAYRLLQTYLSPDHIPGYDAGWRQTSLNFDLQFLCMAIVIIIIGWIAGIPNQRRVLDAIRDSAHA